MFTTRQEAVAWGERTITFEANTFSFKLFSSIFVVYHNPSRKDTFSPDCRVEKIVVRDLKGKTTEINGDTIPVPLSIAVREKAVEKIDVYFSR
jgi:hypothetical protein